MKRKAVQHLITWKENVDRKPLFLTGMKGVGKTYLAMDFAKSFYEANLYINFETNATLCCAVKDWFDAAVYQSVKNSNLITFLCRFFQVPEEIIGSFLFILDEITMCPEAYLAICDLAEEGIHLPIILISSLLPEQIQDKEHSNMCFEKYKLYPMEFDEFLIANGSEWYVEVIQGHSQNNRRIPDIVHKELINLFEDYLIVGGMPSAVNEYFNLESIDNVAEIHNLLIRGFLYSIEQNYSESRALKMKQIFSVMEKQLLKENKKFQFRTIRKGATYAMYEDAITTLADNDYIMPCHRMELKKSLNSFKLYFPDVGLLNTLIRADKMSLSLDNKTIKKILLENYVLQELRKKGYLPVYWESVSQAKMDFVLFHSDGIVPIEVKPEKNTRSKSLSVFRTEYEIPYSLKISGQNFEYGSQVRYLPYYAVFCL